MTVKYQIKPIQPEAHLFQVRVVVESPASAGQIFALPNWIPGSYMIRDFAKNIVEIAASSEGKPLGLNKLDKSRWQVEAVSAELVLEYKVYAWDLSVRAAHLDATHGFFNGTSVFLAADGFEESSLDLEILPPEGDGYGDWRLATSLQQRDCNEAGFGHYKAEDYDDLIDHPVEMGTFTRVSFDACGVPHDVVLTGQFDADLDRMCRDLKRICEYQIRFFGEPAPMDRYIFLVMVVGDGYGGLEHRASTSLLVSRDSLPSLVDEGITDDYLHFLGLCSHEYFHSWNVKRIKPAAFIPYRLQSEVHTELLWAFEGITSYYDDLCLVRCGLISKERYLELLGKVITRVYRGEGRLKQSVAESSFDAWTKFYKQDENAINAIVSYYAKGAIVAFCLDAEMRKRSSGRVSLDDLMHALWARWLASEPGVGESDIESLASELVDEDMTDFFATAVHGTQDLPLAGYFADLGITLHWRSAVARNDAGGNSGKGKKPLPALGMKYKNHAKGIEITHVFDHGAAVAAGLSAGDILIAVDRYAVDAAGLENYLKRKRVGDTLALHYFRHDALASASLTLHEPDADTCYLEVSENGRQQCEQWLR